MLVDSNIGIESVDDMIGMVHEAIPHIDTTVDTKEGRTGANVETKNYFKLLEAAQTELYLGCTKFTKLSFIVRLLHMKVLNHWTDKSIDMLLDLLREAFPEGVNLPKKYYEA